jgi:RNA polymerase sigma factor (sigma-70 family)
MKPSPNTRLIHDAISGDTEAIEQLLLQYHPSVTRFAREFCSTPEDVEDAVQETLWIAAQQIGTLRVASAFSSWLFKIVRHQCFRLLKLARHTGFTSELLEIVPSDEDTERQIALRHDLTVALATLPPAHREVFFLRDLEELPASEVAGRLGITVMTVKSRLHRARTTLRLKLQEWK